MRDEGGDPQPRACCWFSCSRLGPSFPSSSLRELAAQARANCQRPNTILSKVWTASKIKAALPPSALPSFLPPFLPPPRSNTPLCTALSFLSPSFLPSLPPSLPHSLPPRWKVRFSDGESLIYRGDVLAGGNYAKATASIVDGDILQPFTGITGRLRGREGGREGGRGEGKKW